MSNSSAGATSLVGRILISLIFVMSGFQKFMMFSMMTGVAAAKHLPMPTLAIGTAATIEVLGGLAILAGFHTKLAAWVVFLFLIPDHASIPQFLDHAGHGAHGQSRPLHEEPRNHGRPADSGGQRRGRVFGGFIARGKILNKAGKALRDVTLSPLKIRNVNFDLSMCLPRRNHECSE